MPNHETIGKEIFAKEIDVLKAKVGVPFLSDELTISIKPV